MGQRRSCLQLGHWRLVDLHLDQRFLQERAEVSIVLAQVSKISSDYFELMILDTPPLDQRKPLLVVSPKKIQSDVDFEVSVTQVRRHLSQIPEVSAAHRVQRNPICHLGFSLT